MNWKCAIGIHDYRDLQRETETFGQFAVEECLRCGKSQQVYRLFNEKTGEETLHPRVRKTAA